MHSAHGLPYRHVHAQMAAYSASWLSASVKQMVINPLSFACFRDPSPLSRGAQFGGILSRDQADLRRRGFGTDQHRKAQLDACRMAKRILGFLLLLLISPLKALPGAKPLAKSDPGEKKQNASQHFLMSWGHLVHDFYKCSSPVYRLSPECRQQQRAAPQYRSQGRSEICSDRIQMQRQGHRQRQIQTWYKTAGQELFGGFVLWLLLSLFKNYISKLKSDLLYKANLCQDLLRGRALHRRRRR